MLRSGIPHLLFTAAAFGALAMAPAALSAQIAAPAWSFAVSGDSRNCGDFVMPAIASAVKAENDSFYWHLGDFRWMSEPDQDFVSMEPAGARLRNGFADSLCKRRE